VNNDSDGYWYQCSTILGENTMFLNRESFNYYQLNEEEEKEIWKECIFVFDTSTLLDFYFISDEALEDIFTNTFEKIKDKMWVPQHVELEYFKNRVNTLHKPISQKYRPLEKEIKSVNDTLSKVKNKIIEFNNNTKNKSQHPYLEDESIIKLLEEKHEQYQKSVSDSIEQIGEDFSKRIEQINSYTINDKVLENFEKYLKVGREYTFDEILKIAEKGEKRFISKIPPGYMDAIGPKAKEGIQRYGDLINWYQIIEIAKEQKKPVIFILNDNKEDWCFKDEKDKTKIISPRLELIKEMKNKANVRMWMYSLSQFLFMSKTLLDTNLKQTSINEAIYAQTFEDENEIFEYRELIDNHIKRIAKLNEEILILIDNVYSDSRNSVIVKRARKKIENIIIEIRAELRDLSVYKKYFTPTHLMNLGSSVLKLADAVELDRDKEIRRKHFANIDSEENRIVTTENELVLFEEIYKEIYRIIPIFS
jgi:hypothetical protein